MAHQKLDTKTDSEDNVVLHSKQEKSELIVSTVCVNQNIKINKIFKHYCNVYFYLNNLQKKC